uniref:Uncharacterized protein n=1 Tax=Anguilla anguilla TaxID=7936 RepID=A0A0E9SWF4_ANGAN
MTLRHKQPAAEMLVALLMNQLHRGHRYLGLCYTFFTPHFYPHIVRSA